jgi:hypothetical protein
MIWTSKLVLKEMLLPFIKTRSSLNSDDCRIRLELSLLFFSIVNQKHDIVKQLQRNQFARRFGFEIYKQMGVDTHFQGNKMTLVKQSDFKPENLNLDLNNTRHRANHSGDLFRIRNWLSSYRPSYPKN